MANQREGETFINGEAQAAELLTALSPDERQRILKHINVKSPQVAQNLGQKCFGFKAILGLDGDEFDQLLNVISPKVLGIALKGSPIPFQRQVLAKIERPYAEISYDSLVSPQMNGRDNIKRAQERVVEAALKLFRNRTIL